jgi:hypothetical protein
MASYLVPPDDHSTYQKAVLAPSVKSASLSSASKTVNPTLLPLEVLKRFHFTFLIRNPRKAVPSYYRCCVPPQSAVTGFDHFMPSEAGYRELRELFDYLKDEGVITVPSSGATKKVNGQEVSRSQPYEICIIDADDLLDHPKEIVRSFCENVGLKFDEKMLDWDADQGCETFDKWKGFHDDAIGSSGLKPRTSVRNTLKSDNICLFGFDT